jgi:hypothetical protein
LSDEPHPKTPDPKDACTTPTSASSADEVSVRPIPGSSSPKVESPHDFVRRRIREIRESAAKKNDETE